VDQLPIVYGPPPADRENLTVEDEDAEDDTNEQT
jgi:hypothetical protein